MCHHRTRAAHSLPLSLNSLPLNLVLISVLLPGIRILSRRHHVAVHLKKIDLPYDTFLVVDITPCADDYLLLCFVNDHSRGPDVCYIGDVLLSGGDN